MEELLEKFETIINDFKNKGHDLLDYSYNKFDRDFVEFNVAINELDSELQLFINKSFDDIQSIEHSINLLRKFEHILKRENLKHELLSK